jgi:hypothetical protein
VSVYVRACGSVYVRVFVIAYVRACAMTIIRTLYSGEVTFYGHVKHDI